VNRINFPILNYADNIKSKCIRGGLPDSAGYCHHQNLDRKEHLADGIEFLRGLSRVMQVKRILLDVSSGLK
jgi:hypothetical protein